MSEKRYIHPKYEPLFRDHKTRYILVKGGRGSGKSHAVSSATSLATYDDGLNILFCRYTMVAADVSIIPEFKDKISLFNMDADFYVKQNEIMNIGTGATIYFRGLMASSGNQVARLKSIHGVKWWILDEAQELTDEGLFDNIDLSIRTTQAQNVIILVFNPTSIDHWIYRRFYASLPDEDFNGTIGNVTYISTTYLDNIANLSESFMEQAERMKAADPAKYDNIFLGHFATHREGLVYRNWEEISEADYPSGLQQWYGNDWGYSDDPDALVRMCYDPLTATIYIKQVLYETGKLPRDIGRAILADAESIGYRCDECVVYCDPARPEAIAELRIHYGINAIPAVNRDKAGRVAWLRGFKVKYVGDAIRKESNSYSYAADKRDMSKYTDMPQDGNDHAMDAINYAAVTHLRRLGISNDLGEK